MLNYRLYIGLNDKDTKEQKHSTKTLKNIIKRQVIDVLECGTLIKANGIYRHENGQRVSESTYIVEYLGTEQDIDKVERLTSILKEILNQESILLTTQKVDSQFL